MQLIKGADVFSSAGEKIGSLDRVVLDPETKEVTHIVVEKGILFTTNKVIPIEYINLEQAERIVLNQTEKELEKLPSYDEAYYIGLPPNDYPYDNVEAVYWYPPLPVPWQTMAGPLWYPSAKPPAVKAEKVIPEGTVALQEGARVISQDGKHIGNVELVVVDADEHVSHIVVGEGIFLKKKKLVPAHWIKNVDPDQVDLTVWSDLFDRLPDYEAVR